jgi:hypothetical protein
MPARLGLALEVGHTGGSARFEPVEVAVVAGRDDGGGDADEFEAEPAGFELEPVGQVAVGDGHRPRRASESFTPRFS